MSKYGFNPDEVVTTKIDLIDKDGFHGVGSAEDSGSGENSGGNGGNATGSGLYLEEGIHIYYTVDSNDLSEPKLAWADVMVVLTNENHPELFSKFPEILSDRCGFYFGDELDKSEFNYYDEAITYGSQHETDKTIIFEITKCSGFVGTNAYVGIFSGCISSDSSNTGSAAELDNVPDNTSFHAVLSFIVNGEATRIEFVDGVWHINGMPE